MSKKIVIFGCSELGREIAEEAKTTNILDKIAFYDSNEDLQDRQFCELPVLSREDVVSHLHEYIFILASYNYYEEMKGWLLEIGVDERRIHIADKILQRELEKANQIIEKRKPRKTLKYVVDLAEHCNLNCQSCDHFSPLAKERFPSLEEYLRDLDRMYELFGEKLLRVDFEGGEPLLNKEIIDYIEKSYERYPSIKLTIITNGILLLQMSKYFWTACRRCNVDILVTKYPISCDYKEMEYIAEKNGVNFVHFSGYDTEKVTIHRPLDLEGNQDKFSSFNECYMGNGPCVMVQNGKLYPCTMIPNLRHFNSFFNKELVVTKKDYVDIHSDITADEIFEFLSNPVPACSYCNFSKLRHEKWGTTKRNIAEWI